MKNAQDSLDISEYAYTGVRPSLLDYLDAQLSYRATELAYRQALGAYMMAVEQLRRPSGRENCKGCERHVSEPACWEG